MPRPASTRPASTQERITRTVIGKNTAASWKPGAPATPTMCSAAKQRMTSVEKQVQNAFSAVVNCGTRRNRRSGSVVRSPALPPAERREQDRAQAQQHDHVGQAEPGRLGVDAREHQRANGPGAEQGAGVVEPDRRGVVTDTTNHTDC